MPEEVEKTPPTNQEQPSRKQIWWVVFGIIAILVIWLISSRIY